jgi:hypothetical protein
LLPLICMVTPDYSSFSVLRQTPVTFARGHFRKLKCCEKLHQAEEKRKG